MTGINRGRGLILAIDTAMIGCAVGVYDAKNQELLSSLEELMTTGQAERLVPMIEQALAEAGVKYADLAAIAVTRGPGAFTGLRIGLATAKGLALALDIPAIGVETFESLIRTARNMQDIKTTSLVLIETKRSDYYACMYDREERAIGEGASWTLENILDVLQKDPECLLVGDAIARFTEEAKQKHVERNWNILEINISDPGSVALCALAKLENQAIASSIDINPLYLRAPDVTFPTKSGNLISQ